jgi:hypothetical protein
MRGFVRRSPLASLLALAACGSDASVSRGVSVSYVFETGGGDVGCDQVAGIDHVKIDVLAPDGITSRLGFPITRACTTDAFTTPAVPAGANILVVSAIGNVEGDANATLYDARMMISAPTSGTTQLVLKPEVAYLSVSWTFGDQMLLPCATEVAYVEVLISTGTTHQSAFMQRFMCSATPAANLGPFSVGSYSVEIDAYSNQGFILFNNMATMRSFERGSKNTYDAVLAPLGGLLQLDWTFDIRGVMNKACDDMSVRVQTITATVKDLQGGPAATEPISCAVTRPYAFQQERFRQGRNLDLTLIGEGAERFKYEGKFTMPDHDWNPGTLVMNAVGSATVSIALGTSTCGTTLFDFFRVSVTPADPPMSPPLTAQNLAPGATSLAVVDAPYGAYLIEVDQMLNNMPICSVQGSRTIASRQNQWDPFKF